jgi:hypothetical protein
MSEHVSLRIALLDKQLVDCEERPFGRVDDVDLELPEDGGRPAITALLTGQQALGERLGGLLGRGMVATATRLRDGGSQGPSRIDPGLVRQLEPIVVLGVALRDLPQVVGLERWLAAHVVEPLPGAGDARD